ncbi:glycerol-3-phosphate 1-O-acyltransferase PlsB [soil metagenome]
MEGRPLVSYDPNPILGWLYHRFFTHIEVDEAWADAVRDAERRGTVVYVMRNLSFIDFFALDYLTKRHKLPQVRFANDLGLWVLEPMGRGWLQALRRTEEDDVEDLRRAVGSGSSAALFLKRPPTLLEPATRGRIEGDKFLRTLLDVQRHSDRPLLLVPQVFVWSKQGDAQQHTAVDAVLGPREWPGKIRTVAQFLANYRNVTLRSGEPLDVRAFLETEERAADPILVRRMTYVLLRRLERERRGVIGPTRKPADRLREEVLRSPKLSKVITDMAGEGEGERRVLLAKADGMIREMEAQPDSNTIAFLDVTYDRTVSKMYDDREVDKEGLERVRQASKEGTLVLLPSHKSHLDYIVLTKLLYENHMQLPLIAAGDNLNFFPMGSVLRRAGAFFIRRSFGGDRLYGSVVDAYIRRLLKDGWTLEFFLEGGRSRTGKLLPPKLGLLSIVVDAALGITGHPVHFVPISIGYERVVEEKSYVDELSGGEKGKEDMAGLLGSANILAGRYGRISVQFGEILSLDQVLSEIDPAGKITLETLTPAKRRALVSRLAYRVMNQIDKVTAVTPGALVAAALLVHGARGVPHGELVATCDRLGRTLHRFGARFSPTLARAGDEGHIRVDAIREACELFIKAGHVEARLPGDGSKKSDRLDGAALGAIYLVTPEARLSLDIAKNIVVHFFVDRGLVATSLFASERDPADVTEVKLRERVQRLSKLFKYEFSFRADASFDAIFDELLGAMANDGEIVRESGNVVIAKAGRDQMQLYAFMLRNFFEGYRVAARALGSMLKGPLTLKDLTKRALTAGERMHLSGEIERRESVSRPVLENAFHAFVDLNYVNRSDGKLSLPESYASQDTVATVEARIARFLE